MLDEGFYIAYALMLPRIVLDPDTLDFCWVFTGARHTNGYGNVRVLVAGRRHTMTAHKLSYTVNVGPVPDGLVVRHLCDNRRCVRPAHLTPGTHVENMADLRRRNHRERGTTDIVFDDPPF